MRPQAAINAQLVSRCDILLGLFWTKIGTSTGIAESGTVEEIDQCVASGKPTLLYFSHRKVEILMLIYNHSASKSKCLQEMAVDLIRNTYIADSVK